MWAKLYSGRFTSLFSTRKSLSTSVVTARLSVAVRYHTCAGQGSGLFCVIELVVVPQILILHCSSDSRKWGDAGNMGDAGNRGDSRKQGFRGCV
jgi:hypothetical protein